jgi:hypothetical protein
MDTSCTKYHLEVILDARYSKKLYRDENSLGAGARQLIGKTCFFTQLKNLPLGWGDFVLIQK